MLELWNPDEHEREITKLEEYAEKELDLLTESCTDEEAKSMQILINKNIMELITLFCTQGHSGTTAPYVLHVFERLASWKPLLPLTGEDDEWQDVSSGHGDDQEQNIRFGSVFRRNHDNATAYNIEGRIFQSPDGSTYATRESIMPVIFPYQVPDKPEIVKVKNETPEGSVEVMEDEEATGEDQIENEAEELETTKRSENTKP